MKISKDYLQQKKNPHLHSPAHMLADELANKLGDSRHFGFYLKTAITTDHNVLRRILGGILEGNSKQPGALFAYLVKKYNREKDISQGYSLWLIPNEQYMKDLSGIVQSLAQTFDSPVFKPHLSLLSALPEENFDAVEKLSKLKEVTLKINSQALGDEFFKSIYLPVEKSKELMAIRRLAKKELQADAKGTFSPHITLLYSNISDDQKKPAIKELGLTMPQTITFNRIALVKTTGKTSEWKTKQLINLTPQ